MSQELSREWIKLKVSTQASISKHFAAAPVPVGKIATDLGLLVKVSTLAPGISGEIGRGMNGATPTFIIRVSKHEAKERQRFTIAHEIAHALLHSHLIKDSLSDDVLYRSSLSNSLEAEANRLAADIVMPWVLIHKWMEQFPNDSISLHQEALAKYLQVSKVAIEIRLGKNG